MSHVTQPRAVFVPGQRWTPGRKEALVRDIRKGRTTVDAVLAEHGISAEELASWMARFERHGRRGLKVTELQVAR